MTEQIDKNEKYPISIPPMVLSFEKVLKAGCEILSMQQGVLLHVTSEHIDVIAKSNTALPPQTVLLAPIPADLALLPHTHSSCCLDVKRWAKDNLGADEFIIGRVHKVGTYHVVLILINSLVKNEFRFDGGKLFLLDNWLESVLQKERGADDNSLKHAELFGKLQTVANIGVWEVDMVDDELFWSSQTRVIHEVSQNYVPTLASAIEFYKEGSDREEIARLVNHAIETGEPWTATLQLVTAKGNAVWVENHGMVEMFNGHCVRLFGTFQDVDKSVKLRLELEARRKEAEAAYKERSHLLSRISHELRTPLNGITGMLQAIKSEQRVNIRERKTDLALKSADRLLLLIDDVLDYTEISSGELELKHKPFCVRAMAEALIDLFKPLCKEKGIRLYSVLSFPDNTYINGDAKRIEQIIAKLLNNAVKFTSKGFISIQVTLREAYNVPNLLISIEDTGEGIDEVTKSGLFKPFVQGQTQTQTLNKESGTGLGLSIVKQLVDKMGGEVDIRSQVNVGTTFDIVLPVTITDGKKDLLEHEDALPSKLLSIPLSILVVDDNEINRLVLTSMLEKYNLVADEAEDGQVAIEKAREKDYDLIFMDCAMPVLDGVSATKAILKEGLLTNQGSIVAVTANTSEEDRKACIEAGMAAFLCKPLDQRHITAELKKALMCKFMELQE
ncbi:response regulator [Alteromonas sp. 1_MG-2023]|uniref:response regulator n=1 Tax=Alteromonas sp. 1_MG-2023 TaxID=3062669 RepID=UPI0026E4594F|nr:response regulator [Alteromonas sp. 1_MG-2023]MDO6567460.1 response regulator [Alteromonas sp. 1_MG-2023]